MLSVALAVLILPLLSFAAPSVGAQGAHAYNAVLVWTANTSRGHILFTHGKRALYMRSFDAATRSQRPYLSTCGYKDGCAQHWPPLIALTSTGLFVTGSGINRQQLSTVLRTNAQGQKEYQVTYYGHPLYYNWRDRVRGATNGSRIPVLHDNQAARTMDVPKRDRLDGTDSTGP
jgi:predicted lipoprotein with Yx(FWY)xxD motif